MALEKRKVDMKPAEAEIKSFEMRNGVIVDVTDFIPYEEKEEMAMAMANAMIQTDEDLGVCYKSYIEKIIEAYLFAKYYTNIDVEDAEVTDVCDFLMAGGKYEGMKYHAGFDLAVVMDMADRMFYAVKARMEKQASLGYMVKGMLNTNPDTDNAETRELIEKLIDMKGALLDREKNEKKNAAVKTGGAVINLAKRKKN